MNEVIGWNFGALHDGGGKTVGWDFLEHLAVDRAHRHLCFLDGRLLAGYGRQRPAEIRVLDYSSMLRRFAVDQLEIPRQLAKSGAQCLVTLGNIGSWRLRVPHGVFIQTPYLAFPADEMKGVRRDRRYRMEHLIAAYFRPTRWLADGFAVQTETMKRRFCARWGVPASRVKVIRWGLPAEFLRMLEREPKRDPEDPPLIVTASSDAAHKNLDLIPEVAVRMSARRIRVRFAVTLDPRWASAARLQRRAAALGVPNALFMAGRVDVRGMVALLRRARGAFLPSLLETLGLPYLEAAAAGVPVAASDRGFAREICGEGAAWFDPLDPDSAADAVEALLDGSAGRISPPDSKRTASDVVRDFIQWALELGSEGCASRS